MIASNYKHVRHPEMAGVYCSTPDADKTVSEKEAAVLVSRDETDDICYVCLSKAGLLT